MVDLDRMQKQDVADAAFFLQHPDRHAHIRPTFADYENRAEFWRLGSHDVRRRRIILWRVPEYSPYYDATKRPLLKIPFLAFADETVEDLDEVLLPIIHEMMLNAKAMA